MTDFKKNHSIAQFKASYGVNEIEIITNPKTGKDFFVTDDPKIGGKVSTKIDLEKPVQIAEAFDQETGEEFFMFCNKSTKNVKATF